jgi:hypothetical protein
MCENAEAENDDWNIGNGKRVADSGNKFMEYPHLPVK